MNTEYLKLAKLIPKNPWVLWDTDGHFLPGPYCLYCETSKRQKHHAGCPWRELNKLRIQFQKEYIQWKKDSKPKKLKTACCSNPDMAATRYCKNCDSCCANEDRTINGGCKNCGDPSF